MIDLKNKLHYDYLHGQWVVDSRATTTLSFKKWCQTPRARILMERYYEKETGYKLTDTKYQRN